MFPVRLCNHRRLLKRSVLLRSSIMPTYCADWSSQTSSSRSCSGPMQLSFRFCAAVYKQLPVSSGISLLTFVKHEVWQRLTSKRDADRWRFTALHSWVSSQNGEKCTARLQLPGCCSTLAEFCFPSFCDREMVLHHPVR